MNPVTIEYLTDGGPATAAAVARGQTKVFGAVVHTATAPPQVLPIEAVDPYLRSLGSTRRVYADALLASVIEKRYDLPLGDHIVDIRTMCRLLDQDTPVVQDSRHRFDQDTAAVVGNAHDRARCVLDLYNTLQPQLTAAGLGCNLPETPPFDLAANMTLQGIRVDGIEAQRRKPQLDADIRETEEACNRLVREKVNRQRYAWGWELNLDWPESVRTLVYHWLNLPIVELQRNMWKAVSDRALFTLERWHPVIPLINRYRMLKRQQMTLRHLASYVTASTGRLYPELDLHSDPGGRITCVRPDLQSLLPGLRTLIIAEDDHLLLELDVPKCELQMLASLSRDPQLAEDLRRGRIHQWMAGLLLHKKQDEVTSAQRLFVGKPSTYAVLYSLSGSNLSDRLDVDINYAKRWYDVVAERYPILESWKREVLRSHPPQHFYTPENSQRALLTPPAWSNALDILNARQRAFETMTKRAAGEITSRLLLSLQAELPDDCRLLAAIGDSVLISVPRSQVDAALKSLFFVTQALPVPLQVQAGVGATWQQCGRSMMSLGVQGFEGVRFMLTTLATNP